MVTQFGSASEKIGFRDVGREGREDSHCPEQVGKCEDRFLQGRSRQQSKGLGRTLCVFCKNTLEAKKTHNW